MQKLLDKYYELYAFLGGPLSLSRISIHMQS